MKPFTRMSIHVPAIQYDLLMNQQEEEIINRTDKLLFSILKGLAIATQNKLPISNENKNKEFSVISSVYVRNELKNFLEHQAFDNKMLSNNLMVEYIKISINDSFAPLPTSKIIEIKQDVKKTNDLVTPYIQADISKIHNAAEHYASFGHLKY